MISIILIILYKFINNMINVLYVYFELFKSKIFQIIEIISIYNQLIIFCIHFIKIYQMREIIDNLY